MKRLSLFSTLFALLLLSVSCEKEKEITPLACDVTSTDVTSFGAKDGTITVTVKTGNGGYQFTLNSSITSTDGKFTKLDAGTYEVKVTDNEDQMFTKSVTITQPSPNTLDVNVSKVDVTTFNGSNGSITLTVNSGYKPFKYFLGDESVDSDLFNHTFSNLVANTYSVKVIDSLDRTFTQSVTITQPNQLSMTIVKTNVTCFGGNNGSITVTASGETSPYTYKLNSGSYSSNNVFNGLNVGSYTIWAKSSNNVEISEVVQITQPTELTFTYVVTNPTTVGGNGTITVTSSGGTPSYTYQLNSGTFGSNNVLTAPAGTHSITVKDANGCTKTVNGIVVEAFVPNPPIVNTNSATNATGTTVTLNGQVNPNGTTTSLYFQYGTTTSYGNTVNITNQSGSSMINVSANLTGLSSQTTYHFRLVAVNSGGTTYGENMTFTTGYKVGDEMFGGTVYQVSGFYPYQTGLVVWNTDETGNSTWYIAVGKNELRNGKYWITPGLEQAQTLCSVNSSLNGINPNYTSMISNATGWYWTTHTISGETGTYGTSIKVSNGEIYYYQNRTSNLRIRLITTF